MACRSSGLARGGAQERFGITPDLSTFGKVIGGGLPVGAFGGRAEIMDLLAPLGPVYQAGTLSGNPIAMAAGLALAAPDEWGRLAIPASRGRLQPSDDLVWGLGMLAGQGPSDEDALDRFGHIQPGSPEWLRGVGTADECLADRLLVGWQLAVEVVVVR